MSFLAELKRRKVFRVAAAYLVAAWIVLQVAATLLPVLELPSWTVKLVAVLLILGFPFALILGYIFDITPGGIERTSDAAPVRFPVRAAMVGSVVVLIGVVGFLVVRRQVSAAGIDPNSVVVLPFRVSGDEKLAVMREGMVDLIAPKLTGVGGPKAVDSRTTLSAWRSAVNSESEDLAPRDAIRLARKLKASQVILGEVVGAPGGISINARVYSTIDGIASDPAHVETSQDSLLSAIDVLVAELLTRHAGEGERLEALLTSSLPAVRAYLDGNRNYRLGKYEEASKQFGDAVDIDSTFALAAYGEVMARSWSGFGPRYTRASKLAYTFKDRLPPRERALLVARMGESWPEPQSYSASLRGWEQVSTQYPDSPEMWYELGDHYFHYGQPLGMEDFENRALSAWSRAIALDSSYAPPWEHQIQIHAARADTARLRVAYAHLLKLEGKVRRGVGWLYAIAMKDDTMHSRIVKQLPEWPPTSISDAVVTVFKSGVSPVGLDSMASVFLGSAATDAQRIDVHSNFAMYQLNRGRPASALAHYREAARFPDAEAQVANHVLWSSIAHPELASEAGEQAAEILRKGSAPANACALGIWEELNGRTGASRAALQLMRDSMDNVPARKPFLVYCSQVLKATAAVMTKSPGALAELQRMDSVIINGPMMGSAGANFTAVLMARLYAQVGDFERAYRASVRGGYTHTALAAQTLEHARMAARAGKTAEAIKAYRVYLAMHDDPETGPATDLTDKVRAELAALTSR